MTLRITSELRAQLLEWSLATPGEEVCGLLFGHSDRIADARKCANVSPSPANSFEIDPAALIAAHKAARAGGPRLIGCFHSHPNGVCTPSARDADAAGHGAVWLIIAGGDVRAWRFEKEAFVPLALSEGE